jgi:hypothetical protein
MSQNDIEGMGRIAGNDHPVLKMTPQDWEQSGNKVFFYQKAYPNRDPVSRL